MAQWAVWETAFSKVSLRDEGDNQEKDGAREFNLDLTFPNYVFFWQRHVIPATCRPSNHGHLPFIDPTYSIMTQASHGVYCDLLEAERCLVKIKAGDLGSGNYQNCHDALKHGGNAMQKLTTIQKDIIPGDLSAKLGRPPGRKLEVWTGAEWNSTWKPRYDILSGYRNFLIHSGAPQVVLHPDSGGNFIPHVPHEDYFAVYEPLSWDQQMERSKTHFTEWDAFSNVCIRLHTKTIVYINDVYAELLKLLDPFLANEDYQNLWGWDTSKYGSQAARRAIAARTPVSGYMAGVPRMPPYIPGSGSGFSGS